MKLTDEELEALSEKVAQKLSLTQQEWVDKKTAQQLLGLKKSSLAELRNKGVIVYAKVSQRHFMYSRQSIISYLESKTNV